MPELPEAETIVRTLRPFVQGRRIQAVRFLTKRVSDSRAAEIKGRTIAGVTRYGKHIHFLFDRGRLAVKLGMTGSLLVNGTKGPYTRAILELDGATILFDDIRQFGSITLLDSEPAHLGPDPLEITPEEFAARLRARNTDAKRLLLDQSFLRGIGNIYADEALFRAGIHPKARTRRMKPARARSLHAAIREVLEEAIALRGSSISDYVDAAGEPGSFQLRHRVYQRQGEGCIECGHTIRRIVLGQRGAHFCPRCQRRF